MPDFPLFCIVRSIAWGVGAPGIIRRTSRTGDEAEHTRQGDHGLDVGDTRGSLASSDEVAREVEVITMASKPSDNGIS